ncbi:hypothetical protein [Legionella worsleiensis]|uniref:Chromosome partition protein Smc n=1 Tax=Legionella worsleiensis TaxID=45076 RepID=A0A0W1A6H0_9GAMM|nr:hypothetical protein [Legionella worsleiensis]KTD76856.1 Chromosome partition protein Smc [Legionella worsleiensis]STY33475.1 ATPase involved in DNA repair [Legionella worsleiensis]
MPKPNDLNALQQILSQDSAVRNPHYFLFMLGTDTVYTHRPTATEPFTSPADVPKPQRAYIYGETLSYMAQVVADRLDEGEPEINTAQPLSFSTPSVDVVNGPTTLGYEVGERIAQGVFLVLQALAEGKQTIQISAHSRGAVESILIAHELERIKTELQMEPGKTLFQIMSQSPCTYTKKAVVKFFSEVNEPVEVRQELSKRLTSCQINMFLIDPVPGGSYLGLGRKIAWRDDRFYQKPPCSHAELIIFRDERTRCFIPVKPQGLIPLILPGHHGTASGNVYTQQFDDITITDSHNDTSLVQKLAVFKLLHFINKSTNLLNRIPKTVALEHSELDIISNEFGRKNEQERAQFILELYKEIRKNDQAYQYFSATSYAVLGREASKTHARYIHADGHNYTSLDTLSSSFGRKFINKEHAILYLLQLGNFEQSAEESQPDDLIRQLDSLLNTILTAYDQAVSAPVDGLASLVLNSQALLHNDEDRKTTFEALSLILETIGQRFLRNHLSVAEKSNLLSSIDGIFGTLQRFKKPAHDAPINKIISECESILRTNFKNTAQTYYSSLIEQSNRMLEQLRSYGSQGDQINGTVNSFIAGLERSVTPDDEHYPLIIQVITALKAVSPVSISAFRTALNEQISSIQDENKSGMEQALTIIAQNVTSPEHNLDYYLELDSESDDSLFAKLDRLHDEFESLINGFNHVKHLAGEQELNMDINTLTIHSDLLIRCAADKLVKSNSDLRNKPEAMRDDFFNKVKTQAIILGGTNPEVADLYRDVQSLRVDLAHIQEHVHHLNSVQQEENQKLTILRDQYQQLAERIPQDRKYTEAVHKNLKNFKEQYKSETAQRTQQHEELNAQLLECNAKLEALSSELAESKSARITEMQELREEYNRLFQQLADNRSAFDELQRDFGQSKTAQSNQIQILRDEQTQLTQSVTKNRSAFDELQEEFRQTKAGLNNEIEQLKAEVRGLAQQLTDIKANNDSQNHLDVQADDVQKLRDEQRRQLTQELDGIRVQFNAELQKVQEEQQVRKAEIAAQAMQLKAQEELIQKLCTPAEMSCMQLIETKLIPLTKDYMIHLLTEARKFNPAVDPNSLNTVLPELTGRNESDLEKYQKISTKLTVLNDLLNDLENKEKTPLPSARIKLFTQSLKDHERDIKQHRDSKWMQFYKNCMVSIGIICSGIIPGLVALVAYSRFEEKSSPLFFTRSKGDEYTHQVAERLTQLPKNI